MGREVRITDRAMQDIALIAEWQAAIGPVEALRRLLASLSTGIKNLAFTPLASPLRPEIGARARTVAGHTIVYDVESADGVGPCAGDVTVLHVFAAGIV